LLRESALADAGVAVDRHEVRAAIGEHSLQDALEQRELALATDHRGAKAGDAALGGKRELAGDAEGPDSLGLPLQLERPEVLEPEAAHRARGSLADYHLARVGRALQAGGGVHGVAGDHGLAGTGRGRGE